MITLTISDAVEAALQLPERTKAEDALRLLAVKMYEKGVLGGGKAAELCGVSRSEFLWILKEEKIPLNYDQEEFERDLRNLEDFV